MTKPKRPRACWAAQMDLVPAAVTPTTRLHAGIARKIGSLIAKQENEIIAQITDLSNQEK